VRETPKPGTWTAGSQAYDTVPDYHPYENCFGAGGLTTSTYFICDDTQEREGELSMTALGCTLYQHNSIAERRTALRIVLPLLLLFFFGGRATYG